MKIRRRGSSLRSHLWRQLHIQGWWRGQAPATRFVVISTIRSGSTMLVDLIDAHPAAECFYELFHIHPDAIPFAKEGYDLLATRPAALDLRRRDPWAFLQRYIWAPVHRAGVRAVGFKLHYAQARQDSWWHEGEFAGMWHACGIPPLYGDRDHDLWQALRDDREVRIVHLIRRNILASMVSSQTAQRTASWGDQASGGYRSSDDIRVRIEPGHLRHALQQQQRFEAEIETWFADHPRLTLTYEELVGQRQQQLDRVFDFLGLDRRSIAPTTRKLRTIPLRDSILNLEELAAACHDILPPSAFEAYLQE